MPDLSGRTAVVTGANGGLGLESTLALASNGAHVVMAARNQSKAQRAIALVESTVEAASVELVELDLGSLDSVRSAAARIRQSHPRIDILMNNAGLMAIPERSTADGFEMQFGVNHLGHWVLTAELLQPLIAAGTARVVTVTSTAHHLGRPVNPENPHLRGNYGAWKAYGQSKLANFHFALGLQQIFERAGVGAASLAAHPGLSDTDLQHVSVVETGGGSSQRLFHWLAGQTGMSAADGARSQLRAATDPAARGGQFYGPLWVTTGPPVPKPVLRRIGMTSSIDRLWTVSEAETGTSLTEEDVRAAREEGIH